MIVQQPAVDLFELAYVPEWNSQLQHLKEIALPEAWNFSFAPTEKMLKNNYVLERYIFSTFRYQMIKAQSEKTLDDADLYFHIRSGYACFNTGLLTQRYKSIFCFLERNALGYTQPWRLRGFFDDAAPQMRKVDPLPSKPLFGLSSEQWSFSPALPIRVNVDHILEDPQNVLRIPESLRNFPNLPMFLQTGVEIARKIAEMIPSIVVPQLYQGGVQFLLPISLADPKEIDLAMTITPIGSYYMASTCLTPHMAYLNARMLARPTAPWLLQLVRE